MLDLVRSESAPCDIALLNEKPAGDATGGFLRSLKSGAVYLTGAKVTTRLSERVTILTGAKLTPA